MDIVVLIKQTIHSNSVAWSFLIGQFNAPQYKHAISMSEIESDACSTFLH